MKNDSKRIIVIADDLTGAMDTGLPFAKRDLVTVVAVAGSLPANTEVVVINTETRHATATEAARAVSDLSIPLGQQRLYKKVDSTMRGNVGAELCALGSRLPASHLVLCPAFPQAGRTVHASTLYVHGIPLAQTAFRHDLLCPMTESYLPSILAAQANCAIGTLPLNVVAYGPEALAAALQQSQERIVVVDAESASDLLTLAKALLALGAGWIPCGSAGLAEAWAQTLHPSKIAGPTGAFVANRGPVLAVCGSRHPITRTQVLHHVQHGQGHHLDLCHVLEHADDRSYHEIVTEAVRFLRRGENVLMTTVFGPPSDLAGDKIAQRVAGLVRRVVGQVQIGGIYLTGGDIAMAVCRALTVSAIQILDEVQPGLPIGRLLDGAPAGMPVITKAGGFGDAETLLHAMGHLRPASTKR